MALKDFTLGKRNRIAVGGVTAVGLIIYGVSNLIAPAYRVDNTEGERLFEISTHGALGTGTGNAFGTIGQVLTSGGGSGKLMSWTTVPTIAGAGAGADARYVNVAGDTMTGALAIKVTSGTSTGNTLVVDTNGLVYDATNKRVGIGTTSPDTALEVVGTISGSVLNTSSGANIGGLISFSGTNHAGLRLNNLSTAQRDVISAIGGMAIFNTTENKVQAYNGSAWKNVGSMAIGEEVELASAGSVLFVDSSGNLKEDNNNFFWDDSNDYLGIGTNTPKTKLDIYESNATDYNPASIPFLSTAGQLIRNQNTADNANYTGLQFVIAGSSGASGYGFIGIARKASYGDIVFGTRAADGFAERVRVTSAGNVGIGTTSPSATLDVNGNIYSANGNIGLGVTSFSGFINGGIEITPNARGKFGLLLNDTDGSMSVGYYIDSGGAGAQYIYNSVGWVNTLLRGNGHSYINALSGNNYLGIGTMYPTTALEVIGTISGKGLKINGDSDFTGDVVFSETGSGLPYAEIYLADGSTAQAIATGAGYTKLTGYATDGLSNNATSAVASDKITITVAGVYKVDASISASSGTANVTFRYAVFLNGVEQNAIHAYRKYAASGDNGANSMTGYIDVTTVPWDLDVRARHDNGGSINLTPTYMNLNVSMVGGT